MRRDFVGGSMGFSTFKGDTSGLRVLECWVVKEKLRCDLQLINSYRVERTETVTCLHRQVRFCLDGIY